MVIITLIQNIITFGLGSYTSLHRHPVPGLTPSLSPPPTLNGSYVQARHPSPSMTFRTPRPSLWSLPLTLAIHPWPSMIWSLPTMLVLPLYPSDFLGLSPSSSSAWQAYLPSQTPTQLADFLPSFQTQLLYHHLPEPPATSRVKATALDCLSVQPGSQGAIAICLHICLPHHWSVLPRQGHTVGSQWPICDGAHAGM